MEAETCAERDLINRVTNVFVAEDYVVFGGLLLISAFIGMFFMWKDWAKGNDEYLMGGRNIGPIP